jgi:1,4-dihydroxy-2-naphthoate octaprenyltransferase
MSARQKLNQACLSGALTVAAILGAVAQSWLVFFIAGALLIAAAVYTGDVRLHGRRRP